MSARVAMLALALALGTDAWAGNRPPIYGPFALGMPRAAALALAGPGAIAGELCGGSDGVMVERGAASVMADFSGGNVRAIEAAWALPAGASLARCRAEFDTRLAAATRRFGAPIATPGDAERGISLTRTAHLGGGDARIELVSRWFPGGSCDTTLRLSAGDKSAF